MLGWAIAYFVLGLVATAIVLARREPTVVRGDWLFLVTALYVLVAATVTAARGERFSSGALAGAVAVLIAGWLVQSRWWVVRAAPATVLATIEECASRLCAPATSSASTCVVTVPGGQVRLRIGPAAGGSTVIEFVASTRHRKTELFRRLLAKQYRPVIPTVRLGQRSA